MISTILVALAVVWTNALNLGVCGQLSQDTAEPYSRLPLSVKESLLDRGRDELWHLGRCSSGLYVRFSSDARMFNLRWTNAFPRTGNENMSPTSIAGLDMYVWQDGGWQFVGIGKPKDSLPIGEASEIDPYVSEIFVDALPEGMHEYMINLSPYGAQASLEIGVDEGYRVERSTMDHPRRSNPIIIYGTSITQGGSCSRPGMAGTPVLSRRLDREVINLGFSGNAHLDYELAEYMASHPSPAIYVMDNAANCSASMIEERQEHFYRILREAHPDVPIVFVCCAQNPRYRFRESTHIAIDAKNSAIEALYERLRREGDSHLYLIGAEVLERGDNECTVDGTHLSDIGFQHYADALYPLLESLL